MVDSDWAACEIPSTQQETTMAASPRLKLFLTGFFPHTALH